ncbi:zinc finger CCCH-type with G patch domain-containing protein-like [Antedon mediterranea]|uniref:zinc finger CCCH-type with G patch domain-containing protein-like n=1 Tax=Antedon mediterranea TaxID=105859 RepID=UPI003AF5B310
MDERSLDSSIKLYKSQLEQVEAALTSASDVDKNDLLQLQTDLRDALQLTEESLLSLKKSKLLDFLDDVSGTSSRQQLGNTEDEFNAELEAFRESLSKDVTHVEGQPSDVTDTLKKANQDFDEVEEDELCGTQCCLLYSQEWGESQYHNAIVLNSENTCGKEEVKVRVLFCNPTHVSMVPCPYFLEGKCKFLESDCKFSHGHLVNVEELENYKEPDFSKLETGCKCLAKHDMIWHKAIVGNIDLEKHQITVQYENYDESATLDLDSILPIENIEYSSSSESEEEFTVSLAGPSTSDINLLWKPEGGCAIGEWEKYTSGIGSKLMLKMGYEYGKGLGKNGEGRVEPVEAVIVPQGKSLDHCMELKEKKKLKIVGKKRNKGLKKSSNQTSKKKENVFEFINSRLGNHKSKANERSKTKKDDASNSSSARGLNIKLVQTQEEIKKVEKHLVHKKTALQRNSRDKGTAVHMQEQINEMEGYLIKLKSSENNIIQNQKSRKQHKKLTIF